MFPSPDFSLGLSLLPGYALAPLSSSSHNPAAGDAPLSEAVQKLNELRNLLEGADYAAFWATLDSDDLYADLIADVSGFEELMRVRVAATVSQAVREVDRAILESWLNLSGQEFDHFVGTVCGWNVDADKVKVPMNKDNEAKGTVVRENVNFDRESIPLPLQSPQQQKLTCAVLQSSRVSSSAPTSSPHEQPAAQPGTHPADQTTDRPTEEKNATNDTSLKEVDDSLGYRHAARAQSETDGELLQKQQKGTAASNRTRRAATSFASDLALAEEESERAREKGHHGPAQPHNSYHSNES